MDVRETSGVEAVWADVGPALEAFVRRRVADPHHAEDIVAEVLVRIHEHIDDAVDDEGGVTAWVWRTTRNAVIDHYRRTARRREAPGVDDRAGDLGADGWVDDQQAALADLAACVRPLVESLPPTYRRALERTELEGRTQAEAARLEGVAGSTMKSRVQRGRRLLAARVRACCAVTLDRRGGLIEVDPPAGGCACSPSCAR